MAEMSMNKVIHSAFRRDLTRFIDALTAFSPGDRARARQLGAAWENFDDQLTYHHEGEHEIAWPALAAVGVSPDLLIQMDSEHEVMASALAGARKSLAALQTSPTSEAASAALVAFKTLQAATVEHLDHEEAELEPVYLANREHPAITEMGKKFGKVSPVRGGRFFAWLTDGAGPEDMAALTSTVPGPVIKVMSGIFGRGYRKNVASAWK